MIAESEPPAGLLESSEAKWRSFWSSDVAELVRDSDLPSLVRWIEAVDELHRVRADLTPERVVKGSMGQPVLNPLATYAQQLVQEIARIEDAFGMTPTARVRLLAAAGEGERSLDDDLARLVDGMSSAVVDAAN